MSDIIEVHITYNHRSKSIEMKCPASILTTHQILSQAQEGLLRKALKDPRVAAGQLIIPATSLGGFQ